MYTISFIYGFTFDTKGKENIAASELANIKTAI